MIPILVLVSSYILFIIFYRKQSIISDQGYYKILFFSLAILFYFISNLFVGYTNFLECSMNYLFKHSSIMLICLLFYIHINFAYELGLGMEEMKIYLISITCNISSNDLNTSNYMNDASNPVMNKHNIKKNSFAKSNNFSNNYTYHIKRLHSLMTTIVIFYPIFFIILLISIIHYRNVENSDKEQNSIIIQDQNGLWFYKCSLENQETFMYSVYLIFFIYTLLRSSTLKSYYYIFRYIKKINYSTCIGITIGPLINVIL